MKLKLGNTTKAAEIIVGSAVGYIVADKAATKVSEMLAERDKTATTQPTADDLDTRDTYIQLGKIAVGAGIILAIPDKYKMGFADAIDAAAAGVATNGLVTYIKKKKYFGVTGRNRMRSVYRRMGEMNPQNTSNIIGEMNRQNTTGIIGNSVKVA